MDASPIMGVRTYQRAHDVLPEVRNLIVSAKKEFIAIGAAFDRSSKHYRQEIEEAIARGVTFKYIVLSKAADLAHYCKQFGQSIEELKSEVEASDAVLNQLHKLHPNHVHVFRTKRCPNYRMYAADSMGHPVPGIIVFYGNATDTPLLPAFCFDDLSQTPFVGYLNDALRALQRHESPFVFVIHGHNEARRRQLKEMLVGLQLRPIVLEDEVTGGAATVIEKFENLAPKCEYAIAIFTKDDLVEKEGRKYFQARPNVMYEVGWFAASLGRSRVLLLLEEGVDMFSDLQGVLQLRFAKSLDECYRRIEMELKNAELVPIK